MMYQDGRIRYYRMRKDQGRANILHALDVPFPWELGRGMMGH
jgi:hypothetical protein